MLVGLTRNECTDLTVNHHALTDVHVPISWVDPLFELCVTLLTAIHRHSVIILSIGATRMYRGLVDSAALNDPLGLDATRMSTARFASRNYRKEGTYDPGGTVLDTHTTASPQRNLHIKTQDEGSLGSETT